MKTTKLFLLLFTAINFAFAQDLYFTKNAKIKFTSDTPLEKIEGTNNSATSVIDSSKGIIEVGILLKSFIFESALLQEHFHENYLESEKFPKATFKGNILDYKNIKLAKGIAQNAKVSGKLTIHGVTKEVLTNVEFKLNEDDKVSTTTKFIISPEVYGIKIPSVVRDKIAKDVSITVNAIYQKLKK